MHRGWILLRDAWKVGLDLVLSISFVSYYFTLLYFDKCGFAPAGFMHISRRSHVGALIPTSR